MWHNSRGVGRSCGRALKPNCKCKRPSLVRSSGVCAKFKEADFGSRWPSPTDTHALSQTRIRMRPKRSKTHVRVPGASTEHKSRGAIPQIPLPRARGPRDIGLIFAIEELHDCAVRRKVNPISINAQYTHHQAARLKASLSIALRQELVRHLSRARRCHCCQRRSLMLLLLLLLLSPLLLLPLLRCCCCCCSCCCGYGSTRARATTCDRSSRFHGGNTHRIARGLRERGITRCPFQARRTLKHRATHRVVMISAKCGPQCQEHNCRHKQEPPRHATNSQTCTPCRGCQEPQRSDIARGEKSKATMQRQG